MTSDTAIKARSIKIFPILLTISLHLLSCTIHKKCWCENIKIGIGGR